MAAHSLFSNRIIILFYSVSYRIGLQVQMKKRQSEMKSDFKRGSLHFVLLSSMARLELGGKLMEAGFNEKDQHNREWMAATELK